MRVQQYPTTLGLGVRVGWAGVNSPQGVLLRTGAKQRQQGQQGQAAGGGSLLLAPLAMPQATGQDEAEHPAAFILDLLKQPQVSQPQGVLPCDHTIKKGRAALCWPRAAWATPTCTLFARSP